MRLRRTSLYVPGNNPAFINSAGIFGADALVFDLEDSVAYKEKDSARILIKNALRNRIPLALTDCEIMIRINHLSTSFGRDDLEIMVAEKPDSIRYPKTESPEEIKELDEILKGLEEKNNIPIGTIKLIAILETVKGVSNAAIIAKSSKRLEGLTLGAEDFTRDLGTSRTKEGTELMYARGQIVLAAKNAGIQALDTVFSDIDDMEGLIKETKLIKQMGFDGKSVIHPNQIKPIHKIFTPTDKEITQAMRIREAIKEAEAKGSGVIALDGKMIDTPVVKKAEKILAYARALGLI